MLFQVCLVNACKTLCYDGTDAEEAGFHCRMLTTAAFAVVIFCHNDATALRSVVECRVMDSSHLASQLMLHGICFVRKGIDGPHKAVFRNILKVTTEAQPGTSHRDVVGSTLALRLNQEGEGREILSVPRLKALQSLQAFAFGVDKGLVSTILGGNIPVVASSESRRGQRISLGSSKLKLTDGVGNGVEG